MDVQDYNQMRLHYAQLRDEKLLELSLYEATQLTPEALEILREEIRLRGLSDRLEVAIQAQTRNMTPSEYDVMVEQFRHIPCPVCESSTQPLNAFPVTTARGAFFFVHYDIEMVIGCPQCIVAAATRASRTSLIFGWWAIPWGPFRTIHAVARNWRAKDAACDLDPTPELYEYVEQNRGEVAFLLDSS
jgi:hypothetical protein